MKVSDKQLAPVLKLAYDKFVKAHAIRDTKHMRAGFFSGAAVAVAAQNGSQEAVEALTNMACDALGVKPTRPPGGAVLR